MEKYWKVKNVSKQNIKVSVATSNHTSPGIILKPGQFCIAENRLTTPLDAQIKRKFIVVEKDFNNSVGLTLGKAFDESDLDKARMAAKEYVK